MSFCLSLNAQDCVVGELGQMHLNPTSVVSGGVRLGKAGRDAPSQHLCTLNVLETFWDTAMLGCCTSG